MLPRLARAIESLFGGGLASAALFGAINAIGVRRWLRARRASRRPRPMRLPCPSDKCPKVLTIRPDDVEVRCPDCGATVRLRMAGE